MTPVEAIEVLYDVGADADDREDAHRVLLETIGRARLANIAHEIVTSIGVSGWNDEEVFGILLRRMRGGQ